MNTQLGEMPQKVGFLPRGQSNLTQNLEGYPDSLKTIGYSLRSFRCKGSASHGTFTNPIYCGQNQCWVSLVISESECLTIKSSQKSVT